MNRSLEEKSTEPLPRGLVFFARSSSPRHRRRRWIFVGLYLAISLLVIWPIYPRFAAPLPLILGLPQSLVWIVLALGLMFLLLLWFFLTEEREG